MDDDPEQLVFLIGLLLFAGAALGFVFRLLIKRSRRSAIESGRKKAYAEILDLLPAEILQDENSEETGEGAEAIRRRIEKLIEKRVRENSQKLEKKIRSDFRHAAERLASELDGPLSALRVLEGSALLGGLETDDQDLMKQALSRIESVQDQLMNRNRLFVEGLFPATDEHLWSVIEGVLSTKRAHYHETPEIKINHELHPEEYDLFAKFSLPDFRAILSGLIDQSVENLEEGGNVWVSLSTEEENAVVEVVDTGTGLSQEYLRKLEESLEQNDFQEENGVFFRAMKMVRNWGGELLVESDIGKGTKTRIVLPKVSVPDWFVSEFDIQKYERIAVVSAEESALNSLKKKFKNYLVETFENEQVFRTWLSEGQRASLYFLDCELSPGWKWMLDLLSDHGIHSKTILLARKYEDASIRRLCAHHEMKLVSKELIGLIPVRAQNSENRLDGILIDDDPLVQAIWRKAAVAKKKKLAVFKKPQEFFKRLDEFDRETAVYIDVQLEDGVRGEQVARQVSQVGFEKIYLATGVKPKDVDLEQIDGFKGIVGKEPPWA